VTDGLNSTSILLGNGDGTFQTEQTYPAGAFAVAAGDFIGDGRIDLVSIAGECGDGAAAVMLQPRWHRR
jgi:hypothetical protein